MAEKSLSLAVAASVFALVLQPSPAAAQPETRTGFLNVIWVDAVDGSAPEMRLYLSDAASMTRLRPAQGAALDYGELHRMDGRVVVATGASAAADQPGGQPSTAFSIQRLQLERPPLPAPADAAPLTGAQPWVSVLCKFADSPAEPYPASFYQGLLSGGFPSADSFWREASYEAINLVGSIAVGWFSLPHPRSYYIYDDNHDGIFDVDFRRAADDCAAAGDSHINYTAYAGINFVFNEPFNCCAYGGSAALTLDGVTASWRATWLPPWANTPAIFAHEMGHGFGFPHSSGPNGSTYGSKWDMMSWAYEQTGPGTISYHKSLNDWIPQSRIAIVKPGASVTVSLERLAQPTGTSPLMVKIPIRGSAANFYTVEVRRRAGYDGGANGVVPADGVVIHHVMTSGRQSPAWVVASESNNGDPNGAGAVWTSGESFVDRMNGIRVSVLAESPTAATVLVTQTGSFEEARITTLAGAAGMAGTASGTGSAARFKGPLGIAVAPDGIVYVADSLNHAIRRVTPAGVVTTFAGLPGVCGHQDATGTAALFCYPSDVAVDAAGTLFVADSSTHTIRKISTAGAVTTLAGAAFTSGDVDAVGDMARVTYPSGIAVAADGIVYVTTNETVRRVTPAGEVTTLAGRAGMPDMVDGVGTAARFNAPYGLAVDRGILYVADRNNGRIRTVTETGVVGTLAGSDYGEADGNGIGAQFASPYDVAVDPSGGLYVVGSGGHTLRKVTLAGEVTTVAGSPFRSGVVDGVGPEARFFAPQGVAVGPDGRLYVADHSGQTIRTVGSTRLTLSPTALRFGAMRDASGGVGSVTSAQTVLVTTSSPAAAWRVTSEHPWVRVTGGTGTGSGAFSVSIDSALVPPGYVELATNLTATLANMSAATSATVWLTVQPSVMTTAAPIGSFDTPAHGTTGVQGSIAVTGWAVDDIEVSRVELWRDLAPGETTPPLDAPGHAAHGRVFIGNASFVPGARPDVEAAYWDRPHVQQAGWGYMLLTWGLWAQGNGTYTLHALAYDPEGHVASLGTKTIAVNNQRATRPFGAIDTPTYGGTVSGGDVINFGWALTPPANSSDPRHCAINDGGVLVSVDSGPLVPVSYGAFRPDIYAGFPTFSNANGAGGSYLLNTAALANGVHTIGWLAIDSCGRTDGMGSRFFNVTGSTAGATAQITPTASHRAAAAVADGAGSVVQLNARHNLGEWQAVNVATSGAHVIAVAQGDRVEVQLGPGRRVGRHVTNGQRRGLPIGSSYDADTGTFYWQPLEAFLGSFDLEFPSVATSPTSQARRHDDMRDRASERGDVRLRVVVGPPMRMTIDTPRAGDVVDRSFAVAGWALDLAATGGSGVDTVHVWAHPTAGGPPVFLGVPGVGGVRADVGAIYGASFAPSAYDLVTPPLVPGDYDVVVYAHRAATNAFDAAQAVRVTVR